MNKEKKEIKFEIGDIVTCSKESDLVFGVTNSNMSKGKIKSIEDDKTVTIEVLEHRCPIFIGRIEDEVPLKYLILIERKPKVKRAPNGYVTLYNGEICKKEKASSLDGKYYIKDVSMFCIESKWYGVDNPSIALDRRNNTYTLKGYLQLGIVGITKEGMPEKGYFSRLESCPEARLYEGGGYNQYSILSMEVAEQNKFWECLNSGYFYAKDRISEYSDLHKAQHIDFNHTIYPNEIESKVDNFQYGILSPSYVITEGKRYSYGIEIETSAGRLPAHAYYKKLNLKCVHDGSITGGEWVTGILTGDSGFLHLNKICCELSKRCSVDAKCGLHIHVGGALFNKEFTVYSYLLGRKLEKDFFSIVPLSRKENRFCRILPFLEGLSDNKTYLHSESIVRYHERIEEDYSKIYSYLSGGSPASFNMNKKKSNPNGRYTSSRYHWLNLVTCNFCTRHEIPIDVNNIDSSSNIYTVELRLPNATLSYGKIKSWILIFMAFVWFVENRKRDILENKDINLEYVIGEAFPKNGKFLVEFIKLRKKLFSDEENNGINNEAFEYRKENNASYPEKVSQIIENNKKACV